jgi:hypothetical protein
MPPKPPLLCGRPAAGAGGGLGQLEATHDARWRSHCASAGALGALVVAQAVVKCDQRAFEAGRGKR